MQYLNKRNNYTKTPLKEIALEVSVFHVFETLYKGIYFFLAQLMWKAKTSTVPFQERKKKQAIDKRPVFPFLLKNPWGFISALVLLIKYYMFNEKILPWKRLDCLAERQAAAALMRGTVCDHEVKRPIVTSLLLIWPIIII